MSTKKTFVDLIADNKRNSILLMGLMCLFCIGLGAIFGAAYGSWQTGIIYGTIITGFVALFAWLGGSDAIMAVNGARQIEKADAPQFFNVVEELSIAAGIPMPKVYIIDSAAPNAFASGISPDRASVAITTGLLNKLNRDELQGVIAHEIGHVRNFDIRYMMLMAVMVGGIVMLSDLFLRMTFWTGGGQRRSSNRDNGNAQLIMMLVALALAILAPLFATIIHLAMSRQREYLADATAIEFTRNPDGLANALAKLGADKSPMPKSSATEHMYIVSPKLAARGGSNGWFSTHPPIEERIKRLKALKN